MQHFVAYPRHTLHIFCHIVFTTSSIDLPETDKSLLPYFELKRSTVHQIPAQQAVRLSVYIKLSVGILANSA